MVLYGIQKTYFCIYWHRREDRLESRGVDLDFFRIRGMGRGHGIAAIVLFFILLLCTGGMGCQRFFLPVFTFLGEQEPGGFLLQEGLSELLPIYAYVSENPYPAESGLLSYIEDLESDLSREVEGEEYMAEADPQPEAPASEENIQDIQPEAPESLEELMRAENQTVFVPPGKSAAYDWESLKDYETLLNTFYTIDATALAGSDLLNLEDLTGWNLTINKNDTGPQILLYHTHSLEAFADSEPGDRSQTIVGVGDLLTQILTEEYGYNVLHLTDEFDTVRDSAYAKSLPVLEQVLEQYPTIQVIIDLHRDASAPGRQNVVDLNGRPTARFMFFNGISRSKNTGNIDYLYNPNLAQNLAFSFQMQVAAGEYYPGLTRKIYIKQYRYNMHLKGRSLLIELGDETNTLEEVKNACYPIAHLLDLVLSGEE